MSNSVPAAARRRAPGPPGQWLLGSLSAFRKDALRLMTESAAEYGDVVRCKLGPYVVHLLNHPEFIEHVLIKHAQNYDRQTRSAGKVRDACGEGLLSSNGELWKRERRLLQPAFSAQHLQRLGPLTTDATTRMLDSWEIASSAGEPVDIVASMQRLTCSIAARAFFGADVEEDVELVNLALDRLLDCVWTRLESPIDIHRFLPTRTQRRFREALRTLDAIVYRMIARRRGTNGSADDLLSRLLAAHGPHRDDLSQSKLLRDETITMLLAGYETTAGALARSFYLLAREPEVQQRLRDEVRGVVGDLPPMAADLPQLDDTTKVFQESLRLYPPIWIIERHVIEDDVVGEYPIPAGSSVVVSPYTLHRHPSFWEDPEAFAPDRFETGDPAVSQSLRDGYFPFGAGSHQCIGREFAMLEARLILAQVVQRYRLHVAQGQELILRPRITLGQNSPLHLTIESLT